MPQRLCKCGCGGELRPDSKRDYFQGHKPKKAKAKRLCACGCGTSLVNRHPFIKGHNPDATKLRKTGAARKSKASPPRNSTARVTPRAAANGVAMICVTEANLDNFWSKLSLEEKANLYQRQLEGA